MSVIVEEAAFSDEDGVWLVRATVVSAAGTRCATYLVPAAAGASSEDLGAAVLALFG